jgi:hypothetical protein
VKPIYQKKSVASYWHLLNSDVSGGEDKRSADGVIKIVSDYEQDMQVHEEMKTFKKKHPFYNGRECNCSDYAEAGIESVVSTDIDADEEILWQESTTPNQLFKATKGLLNAEVVKDPGIKVDNTFIEGAK